MERDTIFAQASAAGRAGVAVIRISGPKANVAIEALTGRPAPERSGLRRLLGRDGAVLDEALILSFPEGRSFTGELTTEIQGHGGYSAPAAIMRELARIDGLRLAEPGEFTRRALENGRLDLAQVEGMADLIAAETEAQRRLAMELMSGGLSARSSEWRRRLIRARALVEASIDFADEDVPEDVSPEVAELIDEVIAGIRGELAGAAAARRVREGFEVALVGAPNVGKSTLLNALAGRDVAIISEIAGTTRDVLEVRLDLNGLAVTVLDMAGMRATDERIERIGVDRAVARANNADMRVFLTLPDLPAPEFVARRDGDIVVRGKADLGGSECSETTVSGLTGEGVDALLGAIADELRKRAAGASLTAHIRQERALRDAAAGLEAAAKVLRADLGGELAAEELRRAVHALEFLVGRVDLEAVLDEIFAEFCLGK